MIANHKGEIPVALLLLPFMLGISIGIGVTSDCSIVIPSIVLGVLSITFISFNLSYSRFKLYKNRWLGGLLIIPILFLSGWIAVVKYNELNSVNHFSKSPAQYLAVTINSEPILKNGFIHFTAKAEQMLDHNSRKSVNGNLLVSIKDSMATNLNYGDVLLVPATYKPVEPPFNPAEFNYKGYLAHQNIHYQLFLFPKQYTIIDSGKGNPVIAWSLRLRRQLIAKLQRQVSDTATLAVASTMMLGYKANLNNDVREVYNKAGAIHILSVSGAQVGFIYFIASVLLGFLNRYKYGKLLKAVIIISVIWYYALLTGLSPAVCRAGLTASIIIIGRNYSRYINTLNILAISAFILLLYNPYLIADVGFQLSYIAIAGLIIFRPCIYNLLKFKNKWADKLWQLCSVSIAAQAITFPLSAFYFHQFPVYFLISNLLVIIPVAIIMYSGILYLLLPQMSFVSATLAFILQKTIIFMNKALYAIEQAPYAGVGKIWITVPEYILLYLTIISFFYFLYNKKVWLLRLSLFSILLISISWAIKKISLSGSENITWLNLNKHTGIVFKEGNEAVVISDLTQTDKNYQYSIQPCLDSCQVNNVTLVGLGGDVKTSWMVKKKNFIQFLNSRIYLLNGKIENNLFSQKLKTDYLYITNNPRNQLNDIAANFDYQTMVMDGSNSDNLIDELKRAEGNKHLNYKVLKRNKFLISVSN